MSSGNQLHPNSGAITVPSGSGELGRLTLWLAAASGTAAWVVHLVGSYALVPVACATGVAWILHAVTLLTLIPTIAGTLA